MCLVNLMYDVLETHTELIQIRDDGTSRVDRCGKQFEEGYSLEQTLGIFSLDVPVCMCCATRSVSLLALLRTGYFGIVTHGVVWEMATELAFVTLESTLLNAKCSFETIMGSQRNDNEAVLTGYDVVVTSLTGLNVYLRCRCDAIGVPSERFLVSPRTSDK